MSKYRDAERELYWQYQKDLLELKIEELKEELNDNMEKIDKYCSGENNSYDYLYVVRNQLSELIKKIDVITKIQYEVEAHEAEENEDIII